MFRCEFNKELSDPGERPITLVTEKREREYKNHNGEKSYGWEIVTEIKVRERNLEKAQKKYGLV